MQKQSIIRFYFKQKTFEISSNNHYLNDMNPHIYQTLLKNGEYIVNSDVSEKVFQSFLDHFLYNKTPDINPLNISEYDQLSREFDRMKDLIEIFTNLTTSISSTTLKNSNNKLKNEIIKKSQYLKEITENDQKTIEFLFQRDYNNFFPKSLKAIREDLSLACKCHEVEVADLLTRRKLTQNDITFALNEEEKTAVLLRSNLVSDDILIPRSIKDEITQEEYVITSLFTNSFGYSKIKTINFSEDSEVRYFYPNVFFNSNVETVTIPSSLIELKDDWCFHAINLKNIILRNNCHFSYFDEKFIIGKSDNKSDVYDILHFARRDLEEAKIPSFIKHISPSAFNYCRKLRKIQFSENSELISIGCYSLSENIIESITLPSHLRSIAKNAFYFCNHLKKVEFLNDSELMSIENNAFQQTYIECLSIPSSVVEFGERWCNEIFRLKMINVIPNEKEYITMYNNNLILGKSDKKSDIFDVLLFVNRDIQKVIIPPFIKHFYSMSFENCRRLKSIEFENHSELISIGKHAFYSSSLKSISIPKNVKMIDDSAFHTSMRFNRINFHENAELSIIGKDAFCFTSIKSLSIPLNVTKIGAYAFTNCRSLKIIELPENLKLQSTDKELFNNTPNVMIMIPAILRGIYHLKISPQRPKSNTGFVNIFKAFKK